MVGPDLVMQILQNGMNERFAGSSAGTAFGDGSYFADDVGKIDHYVTKDQQYDPSSSLHKKLYHNDDRHPGHVFYGLVCRLTPHTQQGTHKKKDIEMYCRKIDIVFKQYGKSNRPCMLECS